MDVHNKNDESPNKNNRNKNLNWIIENKNPQQKCVMNYSQYEVINKVAFTLNIAILSKLTLFHRYFDEA